MTYARVLASGPQACVCQSVWLPVCVHHRQPSPASTLVSSCVMWAWVGCACMVLCAKASGLSRDFDPTDTPLQCICVRHVPFTTLRGQCGPIPLVRCASNITMVHIGAALLVDGWVPCHALSPSGPPPPLVGPFLPPPFTSLDSKESQQQVQQRCQIFGSAHIPHTVLTPVSLTHSPQSTFSFPSIAVPKLLSFFPTFCRNRIETGSLFHISPKCPSQPSHSGMGRKCQRGWKE